MFRSVQRLVALALALGLAPASAWARDDERGRPWARGTALPTFGFGVGLGRDVTSLRFALGGRYFVANGLAVGLTLSDSVSILSSRLKSDYPGIEKHVPTNVFEITPSLQYVFFRSRWFSPYVYGGVGPSFFNNRNGTFGHWTAGPGAYIGLGGPVFLDVGVGFRGLFPVGRCNDAFEYSTGGGSVKFSGGCAFGWGPNIGIVVAFGASRRGKRRGGNPTPPDNPYETVPASPPPAREPSAPNEPWDEVPPPEPAPVAPAEPDAPPSEVAPVPSEAPPASTPPSEPPTPVPTDPVLPVD